VLLCVEVLIVVSRRLRATDVQATKGVEGSSKPTFLREHEWELRKIIDQIGVTQSSDNVHTAETYVLC